MADTDEVQSLLKARLQAAGTGATVMLALCIVMNIRSNVSHFLSWYAQTIDSYFLRKFRTAADQADLRRLFTRHACLHERTRLSTS